MSLESKHFVASPTEIEAITKSVLEAQSSGSSGRASYLKAIIATTQVELGVAPRRRQGDTQLLHSDERAQQLAALERVHLRFYAVVDRTARELFPVASAREINRRTNFARSAMSTVRAWIRVGNDITALAAARVTKRSLQTIGRRRQPSPVVLANRARRAVKLAIAQTEALAAADRDAAKEQLRALLERIRAELAELDRGSRPRPTAPARLRSVA